MSKVKNKSKPKARKTAARDPADHPMGSVVMRSVPVSKIKPAPYNPRVALRPGDPDYEKIKRSIEKFGTVDPLIWNVRTGNLVGGHQRLAVLIAEYGLKVVDVSVVDLSAGDERVLNIALNRIEGSWDDRKLAELLAEVQADEDVDETLTGFDELEIAAKLDEVTASLADDDADAEDKSRTIVSSFGVMVDCSNKTDQRRVCELMRKKGYKCRVLTAF